MKNKKQIIFCYFTRKRILAWANILSLQLYTWPVFGKGVQIEVDGRTKTELQVNGKTTDIRTESTSGDSGVNSFNKFNISPSHTVNLYVPRGKRNLINMVHSEKSHFLMGF